MSIGNIWYICWNDGEARSIFVFPLLNFLSLLMVAQVDFFKLFILFMIYWAFGKAIHCCLFYV